jgi:hypothetical protein
MKKAAVFLIVFVGILGNTKAQDTVPDTFVVYQRIAFDFGLHWRSYGRPTTESIQSSIMNWDQQRAVGLHLNLNFSLGKNFQGPELWLLSARFSSTRLPIAGTLVLDAETFNLDYTHRLDVHSYGTATRFGFGISRKRQMVKSKNYWFLGGQLGLSSLSYSLWESTHLLDLSSGKQERQVTYAMSPAEESEIKRRMDFSLHAGIFFQGPGLLDFELGLEALPFGTAASKVSMTPFQESPTLVEVPLTYIGIYANAHILRKRRGKKFNDVILHKHYPEIQGDES